MGRANLFKQAYLITGLFAIALVPSAWCGAPLLDTTTTAILTSISIGATNPAGDVVSSILAGKVTDGTLIENFEANTTECLWGGAWTYSLGGASVITPTNFQPTASGYNSSKYCASIKIELHTGTLAFNPYASIGIPLLPDRAAVDMRKATGFRYYYKGGRHQFKVETTNIDSVTSSSYLDTIPASPTVWRLVEIPWDSLFQYSWDTTPDSLYRDSVYKLSWSIQDVDGYVDSLRIDNIEATGFGDRGIAVVGIDTTNGQWGYSLDGGVKWRTHAWASTASALLLSTSAKVRFIPKSATWSGTAAMRFRAWNQVDGRASGSAGVSTATNGGVTAFSTAVATAVVTVSSSQVYPVTITILPDTLAGKTAPSKSCLVAKDGIQSLTATPNAWYHFVNWTTGDPAITFANAAMAATDMTFKGTAASSLTCNFACDSLKLTASPPALTTVAIGMPVSIAVAAQCCPSLTLAYQWYKNSAILPDRTSAALVIDKAAVFDNGQYFCRITDGAVVLTSTNADIRVLAPPVITQQPPATRIAMEGDNVTLTVQAFSDDPLMYQWYKVGVGAVAGASTTTLALGAVSTVGHNRTAYFCIVQNSVGADTSDLSTLEISNFSNPFRLTTSRSDPSDLTHVTLHIKSDQGLSAFPYQGNPLRNPLLPWADDVVIAYNRGTYPRVFTESGTKIVLVPIAEIDAGPNDSVAKSISLARVSPPDSFYFFSYSVQWHNPDTLLPLTPANRTFMLDTVAPVNKLTLSGQYVNPTDAVSMTMSEIGGLTASDTFVVVEFSRNSPFTAVFLDTLFTTQTLKSSGSPFIFTIRNVSFTGEAATIYVRWSVVGANGSVSQVKSTSFTVGKQRPVYSGTLRADSVSGISDMIALYWDAPGYPVDSIRVWWSTTPIPPGLLVTGNQFVMPAKTATFTTATGLTGKTTYYFGLQVLKDGLWSMITAGSTTNATTADYGAGGSIPNTISIKSFGFDPLKNGLQVVWSLDRSLVEAGTTLRWGYSLATNAGMAKTQQPARWNVADLDQYTSFIEIGNDIVFDTSYYLGFWLGGVFNDIPGRPSAPADSQVIKVRIPPFAWQAINYFPTGVDTVYANNRSIILARESGGVFGSYTDTLRAYQPAAGLLQGFVAVSSGFKFQRADHQTAAFKVGIRYTSLPAGVTPKNLKIYRDSAGIWLAEPNSVAADGFVWVVTRFFVHPFIVLADISPPRITFNAAITDTGAVVPGETPVPYSFTVSDNIGNLAWRVEYGSGNTGYTRGFSDTLQSVSHDVLFNVPSDAASEAYGMRARIIVNDWTYSDTIDVSRRVACTNCGEVSLEPQRWTPVRTSAWLNKSKVSEVLADLPRDATVWKYDSTAFRLFRWSDNSTAARAWVEYSESAADSFAFTPGRLMWLKAKGTDTRFLQFGSGITTSLKSPYAIALKSRNWTDFSLPFKFDLTLADIIAENPGIKDIIQLYHWLPNDSGRFVAREIYLAGFPDAQDSIDQALLTYGSPNDGYSIFVSSSSDVVLKIPPIPISLSQARGSGLARQKNANVWCTAFAWKNAGSAETGRVRCGYDGSGLPTPTYYPLPPSFEQFGAGVYDAAGQTIQGHSLAHAMVAGGVSYTIVLYNHGATAKPIEYSLSQIEAMPPDMAMRVFNAESGEFEPVHSAWSAVTVPAHSEVQRSVVVGNPGYFENFKRSVNRAKTFSFDLYPNPAQRVITIHYSVPQNSVSQLRFDIYNLQGRNVWNCLSAKTPAPGSHRMRLYGPDMTMPAGMYLLRITTIDLQGVRRIIGEKRFTYLP
jgi:hypothetical protein